MINHITVFSLDHDTTWEKQLTDQEFAQVKDYVEGKETIPILLATLKPIRTHNLKDFSKDFFLPTTINHAIKVQHTASKIFAILASLILDVLTFPIRLLTCIPRVLSNDKKEDNLFYKYLLDEGVDQKLIASDYVNVRLEWEQTSSSPTSKWQTSDGKWHEKYSKRNHYLEKNVNFIELPIFEGWHARSGVS